MAVTPSGVQRGSHTAASRSSCVMQSTPPTGRDLGSYDKVKARRRLKSNSGTLARGCERQSSPLGCITLITSLRPPFAPSRDEVGASRCLPADHRRMAARIASKQGLLQRAWSAYSHGLESSPILTKGLTSTAGFIVGDVIAQVCFLDLHELPYVLNGKCPTPGSQPGFRCRRPHSHGSPGMRGGRPGSASSGCWCTDHSATCCTTCWTTYAPGPPESDLRYARPDILYVSSMTAV